MFNMIEQLDIRTCAMETVISVAEQKCKFFKKDGDEIICGGAGSGKSMMAINRAVNAAANGKKVAVFFDEYTDMQFVMNCEAMIAYWHGTDAIRDIMSRIYYVDVNFSKESLYSYMMQFRAFSMKVGIDLLILDCYPLMHKSQDGQISVDYNFRRPWNDEFMGIECPIIFTLPLHRPANKNE